MTIILIIVIIILVVRKKNKLKNNPKLKKTYRCEDGKFKVKGKRNNFIVRKNKKIEFLVKDGNIVACRDLRVSRKFILYE
ncbi:MAG: hypothetical protein R3Y54_08995 [Eubacteriales bacterium]